MVDLEFFACQPISFSFAAVTKNGVSKYSPENLVCVFGETRYPGQVNLQLVTYAVAENLTSFKNAIVTIYWKKPEDHKYLTSYKIQLFADSCWNDLNTSMFTTDVGKGLTSYTLTSTPEYPLEFGCLFYLQIISKPSSSTSNTSLVIDLNLVTTMAPDLILTCNRMYNDNGTINIRATWWIPKETKSLLPETIAYFHIVPSLVNVSYANLNPVVSKEYPTITVNNDDDKVNTTYMANISQLNPELDGNLKYRMRVYTIKDDEYFWRVVPGSVECLLSASPRAPIPIDVTTIAFSDLIFTENILQFNVTWNPPSILYGTRIEWYEIYVGRHELSQLEELQQNQYIINAMVPMNFFFIEAVKIDEIEVFTLYCQIRSYNEYAKSAWSDPIVLRNTLKSKPSYTSTAILTPPTTSTLFLVISSTSSSSATDVVEPSYLYESSSSLIPPETTDSSSGNTPANVIGVVVASCVIVVILCLLGSVAVVLCYRYKTRNRYVEDAKDTNGTSMYIKGRTTATNPLELQLLDSPKLDEWEISASNVIIEKHLGEGCFGEVYQGYIQGAITNPKLQSGLRNRPCQMVAIKLLKESASGSERKDFIHEIDTMKKVAEGKNPHVVNMVGCVTIQEPLCLILEFVKHGDLLSYLQSTRKMMMEQKLSTETEGHHSRPVYDAKSTNLYSSQIEPGTSNEYAYTELGEINAVNLLSFAYQIASGMEYLSSLGIVHRDLACRNILVAEGKLLKISDFGMSRELGSAEIYVKSTRGRLPWKWMAIESIVNREFTTHSDVWSYGVTLWEIATLGGFPYPTITNTQLLRYLHKGYRLEKPNNCSAEVYEIMDECWMAAPRERPTFSELRAKFDALISAQEDHIPYIDLEIDSTNPYYDHLSSDSSKSDSASLENLAVTDQPTLAKEINSIGSSLAMGLEDTSNIPEPVSNHYVDTPVFSVTRNNANNVQDKCQGQD